MGLLGWGQPARMGSASSDGVTLPGCVSPDGFAWMGSSD